MPLYIFKGYVGPRYIGGQCMIVTDVLVLDSLQMHLGWHVLAA